MGFAIKIRFTGFGGMASRRNRKEDRLIFQRKRGIHFLSTKFHLERLQIHSYFPVSKRSFCVILRELSAEESTAFFFKCPLVRIQFSTDWNNEELVDPFMDEIPHD